jgi:thiamine pyrophosphokinase
MNSRSFDAAIALAGCQGPEDIFASLLLSQAKYIIAADGGADCVTRLGFYPDLVIGDFDSIENDFERRMLASTELMVFTVDKNHTDGELALAAAVLHSLGEKIPQDEFELYEKFDRCDDLTGVSLLFVNYFGSRHDHTIANLALAALAARRGADVYLTDGTTLGRIVAGPVTLAPVFHRDCFARAGERLFLFSAQPLDEDVSGLTLKGLCWELDDACLAQARALCLSNRALTNHPDNVRLHCRRGTLAVFTFPASL